MNPFRNGDELCAYMRERTGPAVVLWFSMGKDSVAAWLQVRRFWEKVVPVYRYFIHGLRFIEDGLAYYEDFFGTRIHRYPQFAFLEMLDAEVYQTPSRVKLLRGLPFVRRYEQSHIDEDLQRQHRFTHPVYAGVGQRSADSMHRRRSIERNGPIDHEGKRFFPIFDWRFEHMVQAFRDSGVKLPVDYALWNRSFDSPRARFLAGIREHFPDDYERILMWFPLAGADLARREFAQRRRRTHP